MTPRTGPVVPFPWLNWHQRLLAGLSPIRRVAGWAGGLSLNGGPQGTGLFPLVLAIGKAAASCLEGWRQAGGDVSSGWLVAPSLPSCPGWTALVGNHPIPGPDSFRSGRAVRQRLEALEPGATVVVMLSGGASALLAEPWPGLSEAGKSAAHRALIASGCDIGRINLVRRHLSRIKGGRLLSLVAAHGGLVHLGALSDVPGDAPWDIGSGPFSPDPTTFSQALAVAGEIPGFPVEAREILVAGAGGRIPETLKPGTEGADRVALQILGSPDDAWQTAGRLCSAEGEPVASPPWALTGAPETWCQASLPALLERWTQDPAWELGAGECEVVLPPGRPVGQGGRAAHLALLLGRELAAAGCRFDLAVVATDGRDGNSGRGGGFLSSEDLGAWPGPEVDQALAEFNAAGFLAARERVFPGGTSGTNLGDLLCLRRRGREPSPSPGRRLARG